MFRQASEVHIFLMENIARYLMLGGILLFLIGGGVYLAAKFGLPLGRLPGDIHIEGENGSFYFPLTTSILVSVILTIVLNIIVRLFRR
jgi:Protein of unknown function (DUF2905).